MNKKGKMIATVLIALLFGSTVGVIASGASGKNIVAESIAHLIAQSGLGSTIYSPPEAMAIDSDKPEDLTYLYTAQILTNATSTDIGGGNVEESTFYYEDSDGNILCLDEYGRIISFRLVADPQNDWKALNTVNAQQDGYISCIQTVASQLGADIQLYTDVDFASNEISTSVRLYTDKGSPCVSYCDALFDSQNVLRTITFRYSDLQSISAADASYFQTVLESYLDTQGNQTPYAFEVYYKALNGTLIASYSVRFTAEDGTVWMESYVAGKPLS